MQNIQKITGLIGLPVSLQRVLYKTYGNKEPNRLFSLCFFTKCLMGLLLLALSGFSGVSAQKNNRYELVSPHQKTVIQINTSGVLQWSVFYNGQPVILPSEISLQLQNEVLGHQMKIISARQERINTVINATFYKKEVIKDDYTQLTLNCKGDYGIILRAYDEGAAYRFFLKKKDSVTIISESSSFVFPDDNMLYIAYTRPGNGDRYNNSFENMYMHIPLSSMVKDSLTFLPSMSELSAGRKAVITEADLEDYPGMYLIKGQIPHSLSAQFAPYPAAEIRGGYNKVQSVVKERKAFIARTSGTRNLPWRIIALSTTDKELLDNDLVYKLASPSRLTDLSWIKPGKVAWDWWNDWNISHVNFRAGINTDTYKYYIDFASAHHIEYILLDDGWSDKMDIMKVMPAVDLQELINYGRRKNVGVWLWSGMYPIDEKMDEAFDHYSRMGIKGFKIDFMDRDDQKMVDFYYKAAQKAAKNKLMLDFHGAYKPTGLFRTYPNVLNVEGVFGMENVKGIRRVVDFPKYETILPFIRMLAGPMDYTPGAMRNATKGQYYSVSSMPMSQGTRCHQLAMYVVYEAPLNMLSDNPTSYMKESESTDFIASIPTVFDETVALDGSVGNYTVIARRKGNEWFIGALNNWDARDIEVDISSISKGTFKATIFKDGINADRDATDYKTEVIPIDTNKKLKLHLAPGGGWAARLTGQ